MAQNKCQGKKLQIVMEKRVYGQRLTAWEKIQVNNVTMLLSSKMLCKFSCRCTSEMGTMRDGYPARWVPCWDGGMVMSVVVSASDFQPEGWWFETWSLLWCCSLRQNNAPHCPSGGYLVMEGGGGCCTISYFKNATETWLSSGPCRPLGSFRTPSLWQL